MTSWKKGMIRTVHRRLAVAALLLLPLMLGGCFLNVFETGDTLMPGRFAVLVGLGGQFISSPSQWAPQVHLRYGVARDIDLGLSTGLLYTPQTGQITPLGLVGDIRKQLNHHPDLTVGLGLGSLSFSNVLLGEGSLYLSQPFGTLTPYAAYRASLTLSSGGFDVIQQVAAGVAIENPARAPIFLEVAWREGQILIGFAARF